MSAPVKFALISFLAVGLMSNFVLAQGKKSPSQSDDIQSRSIRINYTSGQIDGVRVVVYKVEGSNLTPVDPSRDFRKGDQIKVEFESNFDGYVYFVNVPPSGKAAVIYPDMKAKENNNMILAHQRYVIPRLEPFEFV